MVAIELRNVVKTYDDGTTALDGINLEVDDGEFMVLVGPSGSGKSTLLRVVAGLEPISSGDILLGGRVATAETPHERNLAMVFQSYALYPHLSVYENIAFPLRFGREFNKREIDTLVKEASRTLELDDILDRKPAGLSGGQRQRVAMARAMVRDVQALLLDEPLSNLDAQMRRQMRADISWLQKRLGVTTLYVTHDQSEAMQLGDRVAVLESGSVQQVATPQDLQRHPANLFVAGFIGSPPMSFLPATVRGDVVELPFAWLKISTEKAARVWGREQLIVGVRPEHVELAAMARTDHKYARIPQGVPANVPAHLAEYEKELSSGWLHTAFDFRTEFTGRVVERGRDELYLNAASLHLFDPVTGCNLTQGVD